MSMYKYIIFLSFLIITTSSSCALNSQKGLNEIAKLKAEKYLKLMQSFYNEGEYEKHKFYSDSLLLVASEYGFTKMHVLALTNQAVYHNNRIERFKAIKLYHEALKKCELIPKDFKSKIVVLVNMGNTYRNIGLYSKSIEHMEKVLYLLDKNENSNNIRAAALIGISNNYSELGEFEKSIDYAKKAIVIGEESNNQDVISVSISNICDSYINLKQYEKALSYGKTALEINLLTKETKKRAWLLLNLGKANYHLKEYNSSLNYLKSCVLLAEKKKLFEIEMFAHEYLSKLFEKQKKYKQSVSEQKQYTAIKSLLAQDEKKASNVDLNKRIDSRNQELEIITKKKNIITSIAISVLFMLCVLVFIYFKHKKKLDFNQKKLRQQHILLQQEFIDFKTEAEITTISSEEILIDKDEIKPYKNSSLNSEKREALKKKILIYLKEEKPFLDSDLTQLKLADKLEMSTHHFSEVLHYNIEQNFYNFINSYRIIEAQRLIGNPNYKNSKIIAIAFDSGFKSKTTFNRLFKKYTGITPSEYRKGL